MTNRKINGFVYARLDSTRLPFKAFKEIEGIKLIDLVIKRALLSKLDQVILLTTDRQVDDELARHIEKQNIAVFRGNHEDLIKRTIGALDEYETSHFLRLNGDSPFVEPTLIDEAISQIEGKNFISNLFNRKFPYGVAIELVSSEFYRSSTLEAKDSSKEHHFSHLYDMPSPTSYYSLEQDLNDADLRLTIDTGEDLERIRNLWLGKEFDTSYWSACNREMPKIKIEEIHSAQQLY